MRFECLRNCDADDGRIRKALFEGQFYELSLEVAQPLIAEGAIRAVEAKAVEPVEDKAVDGPPRNKSRSRSRA